MISFTDEQLVGNYILQVNMHDKAQYAHFDVIIIKGKLFSSICPDVAVYLKWTTRVQNHIFFIWITEVGGPLKNVKLDLRLAQNTEEINVTPSRPFKKDISDVSLCYNNLI